MDFAQQKYNVIKDFLHRKLSYGEPKNILDYKSLVKEIVVDNKIKRIWTKAFQKALKENEHIYIPSGEYFIDDTIVITSNRKISAEKEAVVLLLSGTKVVMFRNESIIDGTSSLITFKESYEQNIEIDGGVWGTEYTCRAKYGNVGAYDNEDSIHGVHALMLFSGVKNLWIKNTVFKNTATFALQIGRAENVLIENIEYVNCFADGVHLNGELKNVVVFNISGHTEDDLVALNAYDWDNSTINNGPMEDVTVSRIYATGGHCKCMRIQPGVTSEKQGNIDCYMKNIHISYITGVQTFKLYLQTPPYDSIPEGAKVGRIDNITFENIVIEKDKPSDNGQHYYDKDLITGHFGVFEIGSNVNGIKFSNIDFKLNLVDYPDTAHFITIGPKSWYIKDENLEIFDPYINCLVTDLSYENIKANGALISSIKEQIKEIEFNNLYPSNYSSGIGRLKASNDE